ncbi:hypothetical protein BO70DRAFT_359061 [Aspergillus heteromorphus CBS 117.55]|uniref:Uncharacterized protein n=1 Tax=Aspergillus heteromorphus CBS 117.55 TaxID=1448321 RepID=A0A317WZB7_9EURO|nr:uncharacterized protein BO70DRAFT_359061 [Aspergillus heteromorphus CBS 117.55]PWY90078.1 hypothetical protein BO70DRAFT_359061 [Aspergillus heteromorphus CBS 117.55]
MLSADTKSTVRSGASDQDTTPAWQFLATEIYKTGSQPGLRSLPPSPERDFLTLTWGPIIYLTSYTSSSPHLVHLFLRALNTEIQKAIPRCLPGARKHLRLLETTYSAKVFSIETQYSGADVEYIRGAFHNWKRADLSLPSIELPVRLRICLIVDNGVLQAVEEVKRRVAIEDDGDAYAGCPVILVEENFPDRRRRDSNPADHEYPGWTRVALSAVVEVMDGLRDASGLKRYHRPDMLYTGNGQWS